MKPIELVQFLKEAAAQRSQFLSEGNVNVEREEALINAQSTKSLPMLNEVESLDHADEQPEDQQALHKLIFTVTRSKAKSRKTVERREGSFWQI